MTQPGHLEELVRIVKRSPKYRSVCDEVIRNIGRRELQKGGNLKKAVKATKNKLHQIAGAFLQTRPSYEAWLEKLRKAKKRGFHDLRLACIEIMRHHHSTRMRLKNLDGFYRGIFSRLPPVHSIVDIGCGFHPLAIPWMPLSGRVRYYAYDLYEDLAGFLSEFMKLIDVEGYAEARDVIRNPPEVKVDLAFLLNMIPTLERIEENASVKLLDAVEAKSIVISFPVRSLGGKNKGMRGYYRAFFQGLMRKDWDSWSFETENEMIYVAEK